MYAFRNILPRMCPQALHTSKGSRTPWLGVSLTPALLLASLGPRVPATLGKPSHVLLLPCGGLHQVLSPPSFAFLSPSFPLHYPPTRTCSEPSLQPIFEHLWMSFPGSLGDTVTSCGSLDALKRNQPHPSRAGGVWFRQLALEGTRGISAVRTMREGGGRVPAE